MGYPCSGLVPFRRTLSDSSFCFLFFRIATTSMPEHAPSDVRSALIGLIPLGLGSSESKTTECPPVSVPTKR